MITEYTILESSSRMSLIEIVNEYLEDGWTLHGGLMVGTRGNGSLLLFQAMVNESEMPDLGEPPNGQ